MLLATHIDIHDCMIVVQIERHSDCVELCMDYALGSCDKSHTSSSSEFDQVYELHKSIHTALQTLPPEERDNSNLKLNDFMVNHWDYVSHLIPTKHQGNYYRYVCG